MNNTTTAPEPSRPIDADRLSSESEAAADTKRFSGSFLLFRKNGNALKRLGGKDQQRPPRFRHPTFDSAESEATRLLEQFPDSTFVVIQEVGRVKLKQFGGSQQ